MDEEFTPETFHISFDGGELFFEDFTVSPGVYLELEDLKIIKKLDSDVAGFLKFLMECDDRVKVQIIFKVSQD